MARYTPRHAPRHAAPKRSLGRTAVSVGRAPARVDEPRRRGRHQWRGPQRGEREHGERGAVEPRDRRRPRPPPPPRRARSPCRTRCGSRRTGPPRTPSAPSSPPRPPRSTGPAPRPLAKKRREAAERAARAAERKRVLENAQDDPKAVARLLLPEYGFGESQWSCLDQLWMGESDWRWWAVEPVVGRLRHPAVPARLEDGARSPATGAPTRSPRSRGASTTSSGPTAPRATR